MILTLALRNLFHDRIRLAVTLVGILFSVVLVAVQLGLYAGTSKMIVSMVEQADAEAGSAVVLDPDTGEILALVDVPLVDPSARTAPEHPPGPAFGQKNPRTLAGLPSGRNRLRAGSPAGAWTKTA